MAGLGEACSHVAASMFALWKLCELKKSQTCTSLPCSWIRSSASSVEYKEASEIDFKRPNKLNFVEDVSTKKIACATKIPFPTKKQTESLYAQLEKAPSQPAILSLIPKYAGRYVPQATKLPPPLTELYDPSIEGKDMEAKCDQIFESLKISDEQVSGCGMIKLSFSMFASYIFFFNFTKSGDRKVY